MFHFLYISVGVSNSQFIISVIYCDLTLLILWWWFNRCWF